MPKRLNPASSPPPLNSLLDPPESPENEDAHSSLPPGFPLLNTVFRHSGWAGQRSRVYSAMCAREGVSDWRRLERFASCGTGFWLLKHRTEPRRYRISASCCHSRWCVPCARARASQIADNTVAALDNGVCRLITLTLRSNRDPLPAVLDRLFASFKALRAIPVWKEHVSGSLAFLEVTRNPETSAWHAHFHVIARGTYWAQSSLAAAWLGVTGDSFIVDVALIRDPRRVATYVLKYVTKPIHASAHEDPQVLIQAISALHGRKLVMALGDFRSLKLTAPPAPHEWKPVDWIGPVLLADLHFSGNTEDLQLYQAILDALANRIDADFTIGLAPQKENSS